MKYVNYRYVLGETRFTDSMNITNLTMLILELRNARFGWRDEYLILPSACKFVSYRHAK